MSFAIDAKSVRDPMQDAYETFVAIERDLQTHQLSIGGVHVWSATRPTVFERIMAKLGFWEGALIVRTDQRRRSLAFIENLTLRNPFLRRGRASNFVMKWERMQLAAAQLDDLITRPLRGLLPGDDTFYMHMLGPVPHGRPMDLSIEAVTVTARIFSWANPTRLSDAERARIAAIEHEIEKRLGVRIELATYFSRQAALFRHQRDLFIKLLRKWKVRRLFVVVAYARTALTAAAHACGAQVIELQHGLMYRYHCGYDFPDGLMPAYRPDVLLLYGEHWRHAARHDSKTQLAVFGAPYMRANLSGGSSNVSQHLPGVLFISQVGILRRVIEFALAFARQPHTPKVIFRLHPIDDIPLAKKLVAESGLGPDRFEVSYGGGGPRTLELQKTYRTQVGVFSTAVLEGLALGCKTFLIPVPGWSALSGLIDSGFAEIALTPEALAASIQEAQASDSIGAAALDHIFAAENPQAVTSLVEN